MASSMILAATAICEVTEEARRDRVKARIHLLQQALKIVDADFAVTASVRGSKVRAGASCGLSRKELDAWRSWYDYREDPLALAYLDRPDLSAFSRPMLVDDRTWKRSAHVNEGWKSFGLNETAVSCVSMQDGELRLLSVTRGWGRPPFEPSEVEVLQLLHHSTAWLDRSEQIKGELPLRLQAVYKHLLGEGSEKEIAASLGLSQRTVHKYTEQIYRALNVCSRLELICK